MIKKLFIILCILAFCAISFAGMTDKYKALIARKNINAAPGAITLEDSGYLDENATDTDAVTAGEITVPAGSYNLLLVIVSFNPEGVPQRTISSVYWDVAGANQAFTAVNAGNYVEDDDAHSEAFYLINPTAGASKAVTVNFSADLTYGSSIAVYALSGAAQSSPIRDYDGVIEALDETLDVTLTVISGDFIAIGTSHEDSTSACVYTGSGFAVTELFDVDDTHNSHASAYGTADSVSESCNIVWENANHTVLIAVAVKVAL